MSETPASGVPAPAMDGGPIAKSADPAAAKPGPTKGPVGGAAKPPPAGAKKKRPLTVKTIVTALAGMILGGLIGVGVQKGVEATGVLGPGLDELIAEQVAGFEKIDAKLEELRNATDPQRIDELAGDLESLLDEQRALSARAHDELRGARAEIDRLKQDALASRGTAGGADLWLKPGESATVGERGAVFGVLAAPDRFSRISVNALGERTLLSVGDQIEVPAANETIQIIFKLVEPRNDGRYGFDVVLPSDRVSE